MTADVLFNAGHIAMDEEMREIVKGKSEKRDKDAMKKAMRVKLVNRKYYP